jgi:hypothetical protein
LIDTIPIAYDDTRIKDGPWNDISQVKIEVFVSASSCAFSAGFCTAMLYEVKAWGPAAPTVVTNAANTITDTSATLNGNITATGGENASERGFEWGTVPGVYPNNWTEVGSYGTGAFNRGIAGLASSTTYYFRAKARNSTGWAYGAEMSFTTDASGVGLCAAHEIWGYAWSENIGWISFSCENTVAIGTGVDFGVDIDGVGNLSGYAWSENIGWISFNAGEFGTCPFGFGPCQPNINLATGVVTGYARVCSVFQTGCSGALRPNSERGGWDGWIRLSGSWANGVILPPAAGPTSEFEGWAWGGDDASGEEIIGWISFNSATGGGPTDYAVKTGLIIAPPNNPPTANGFSEVKGDYCSIRFKPPVALNWTFNDTDGDSQSAYQIQIDNSGAGFPSPELDTGKLISSSGIYSPDSSTNIYGTNLSFDDIYDWRIMVWDDSGAPNDSSAWTYGGSFATDPRWPNPSFTWDPDPPPAEWDTQFDSTVSNCPACTYLWDFDTGDSDVVPDPIYAFPALALYNVSLTARSGGLSCTVTNPVGVGAALPLPTWIEITPF